MKELDPRAEALVREAAHAEAEMVLSRAQRDEIRRRFAAHQLTQVRLARPSAPSRAVASIGGASAFGVPVWAAAAVGLVVSVAGAVAVVTARNHDTRVRDSADARPAEPPPRALESRSPMPFRSPAPGSPEATSPNVASVVVEPSPQAARPVLVAAASSARSEVPAASSSASHVSAASAAGSHHPEGGLGAEAALLEAAERSLRAHDGARALALLDEYARRFPDGVLFVDAEAARAIATCETADRVGGAKLAADFARRWPNAPVLARVLVACRTPQTEP
jgi:hypothetical protein